MRKIHSAMQIDSIYYKVETIYNEDPDDGIQGIRFKMDFTADKNRGEYLRWKLVETYEFHNPGHEGFDPKVRWLRERFKEGLRFFLFRDRGAKPLAFLEFIPGRYAWRPVEADGWLFIHCLWVYSRGKKVGGLGGRLVKAAVQEAREGGHRPDEAFVTEADDCLICWPTKLSLAPDLADRVITRLGREIPPPTKTGPTPALPLPLAETGRPTWTDV